MSIKKKKNNNGNLMVPLHLPFSHGSAQQRAFSECAVQREKRRKKGDEKAKEWDRGKGKERERAREIEGRRGSGDRFDVRCNNTSQSQLKGLV